MISRRSFKPWLITLFTLAALLSVGSLQAANYVFPGNLPAGCSGSGGTYSCGSLTLAWGDTITIASPLPASITVNGDLLTNNNQINAGGLAANLTLEVTGTLSGGFFTTINANVTAGSVSDTNDSVTYGGSLTTTMGAISLRSGSSVAGSITTTSGNISLGGSTSVAGNIGSNSGNVTLAGYNVIGGGITSNGGAVSAGGGVRINGNVTAGSISDSFAGSVTYGGSLTATTGIIDLKWGSTVAGSIGSSGAITLAGSNTVGGNISSTGGAITTGFNVLVNGGGVTTGGAITLGQSNVIAGSATSTSGNINFGSGVQLNGNVSTDGTITIGQSDVVTGSLASNLGAVYVGYAAQINGNIATGGAITLVQSSVVGGKITGSAGNVEVWDGARVSGTITTSSGTIHFHNGSTASSCVTTTESATITLDFYQESINSVCCGSSCSTSCVVNNSAFPTPPQCTPAAPTSLSYFPVPVSPLNEDITTWNDGSLYAGKFNGTQTLGGVPFELQTDADGDNVFWGTDLNLSTFSGSSSLTLTLATNLYGATTVYTLINSAWGTAGSNVGSITFNASNGDTYTVQLVEGVNVRDHFYGGYVNTVSSSTVTTSVIGSDTPGTAHLDMQAFALPASFAGETLTSIVFTSTGGSATGLPFLAGATVRAASLGGGAATIPSSFNCVEVGAAANGRLYTKLANTAFYLDVLALKADGSVDTAYAGNTNKSVTLELVDGTGNTACANRSALSAALTQTVTFSGGNGGRRTVAVGPTQHAYPDVRCRISDANQSPAIVGCSSDDFAIRPTSFTVSSTANADATGTSTAATPTVKVGAGFGLTATSDVLGYDGTPKVDTSKLTAHTGALQNGVLTGSFGAADPASGQAGGSAFNYSEAGYFALGAAGVFDDSFAGVDSASGDCTADFSNSSASGLFGCKFGNTTQTGYFGRFIPDHFDVTLNTPVFAPACSTFTYVGQPVKYATIPVATVTAKNTAGATTRNYTGGFWKIQPNDATYGITPNYSEAANSLTVLNNSAPSAADNGNGGGTLSFADTTSNILGVTRTNPIAPFNAEIALSFTLRDGDGVQVANTDGAAGGNPVTFGAASAGNGIAFSGGSKTLRWGRLALGNAYGSELKALSVPLFSEYFNGTAFVANTLDNCTSLTLSSQLILSNPNTASGAAQAGNASMTLGTGSSKATLVNAPLVSGDAGLSFSAPGADNTGYIDIRGNFANLPWLLFDWDHNGMQDNSPSARATFGLYKGNSQQIYLREVY